MARDPPILLIPPGCLPAGASISNGPESNLLFEAGAAIVSSLSTRSLRIGPPPTFPIRRDEGLGAGDSKSDIVEAVSSDPIPTLFVFVGGGLVTAGERAREEVCLS